MEYWTAFVCEETTQIWWKNIPVEQRKQFPKYTQDLEWFVSLPTRVKNLINHRHQVDALEGYCFSSGEKKVMVLPDRVEKQISTESNYFQATWQHPNTKLKIIYRNIKTASTQGKIHNVWHATKTYHACKKIRKIQPILRIKVNQ